MGTSAPARTTSEIADRVAGNAVAPKKTPDDTIKTGPEIKFPETGVSLETSNNIIPPVSGISNSSSVGNTVFGPEIIPVKLEIKEFKDKNNSLYVLITLEKIKTDKKIETEVAGQADQKGTPKPYPISNIRITEIISKINPSEESIYQTNC